MPQVIYKKMNDYPRIVFLGTPDFAVASLKALTENGFAVVAVITAPDKPAGRGLRLSESAVKQFAIQHDIPVLQPPKLKEPGFIDLLKSFKADIQVVVAFRMLPEIIWAMPALGTINLHGSLLPQYRGAAPINRAIMNGETRTGVTTFKLQQEIDMGDILLMEEMTIGPDETAGELHDRMKETGARLVVQTVRGIADGTLLEKPQPKADPGLLKTAPKLFSGDGEIDWSAKTSAIHNQVRGLSPFPGAFTRFGGKLMKIFRTRPESSIHEKTTGESETDGKTWLRFVVPDGYIYVEELQLEGKKRMSVQDFLRGFRKPKA